MDKRPLKPTITQHGQPYVDQSVTANPRPLVVGVAAALNGFINKPIVIGQERVALRWLDANGKPR